MAWTLSNDRPLYLQLIEHIKRQILSGEYAPGEQFPSVRELALSANVNPNTMQRALAELERDGLLINERTNGRRITENASMIQCMRTELAQIKLNEFRQELTNLGFEPSEQFEFVRKNWDSYQK